jgi:hypothetical protein
MADDVAGEFPLHIAAELGRVEVAALLLEAEAYTSVEDCAGLTPLHSAALQADGAVAALLLRHEADPAAADREGNTPIHTACCAGHLAVVRALLDGPSLAVAGLPVRQRQRGGGGFGANAIWAAGLAAARRPNRRGQSAMDVAIAAIAAGKGAPGVVEVRRPVYIHLACIANLYQPCSRTRPNIKTALVRCWRPWSTAAGCRRPPNGWPRCVAERLCPSVCFRLQLDQAPAV